MELKVALKGFIGGKKASKIEESDIKKLINEIKLVRMVDFYQNGKSFSRNSKSRGFLSDQRTKISVDIAPLTASQFFGYGFYYPGHGLVDGFPLDFYWIGGWPWLGHDFVLVLHVSVKVIMSRQFLMHFLNISNVQIIVDFSAFLIRLYYSHMIIEEN
ncbi:hypothetical protein GLOIN_2v1844203 [Rhizophagus irregularis DAOM 181602=DAOM 197198]|uniref:Uncharacterized protein n=1 Tax=Rhizophagus irregularis (strain DAOM 181602 / DAOM 197198 / MUCL 43194) TaxID=747089 RepID=A0A2P4PM18_RHIID|nr:hypothetical protein GLOIN_2v1844203 [Rhizophagus irregularis DAOM 181602=DAOM 197198]POG66436.1 hypothetical protein GLOIN_2v1844203 [Rhizophagus irregularis DAOM 181602=DAOM 197198]|eukprot:XP_025173302.1 hypothetical protein GLOIN_2v1844203 [Rhizophagus irregularis DAOM 181602=DAOM 197198]